MRAVAAVLKRSGTLSAPGTCISLTAGEGESEVTPSQLKRSHLIQNPTSDVSCRRSLVLVCACIACKKIFFFTLS